MLRKQYQRVCTLAFLGLVCVLQDAFTQYAERDFVRYGVQDGLSDNTITCLQQDAQGYVWIGTDEGLNRFDGNSFRKFYRGTTPLKLLSGSIWQLKLFGTNELGIITKGGVQLLDITDYSVRNFHISDTTAFGPQINTALDAEALTDSSFVITTAAGFYVFDSKGRIKLRHDAYHLQDIGQKRILYGRDIFTTDDGRCVVYVEETGLALYDDNKKVFRELNIADTAWSVFAHPRVHAYDHWVVRQQLTPDEFVFVPSSSDSIIYYNYATKKRVISALPFQVIPSLSWESKVVMLNDSVLAINHRTKGFYFLSLDKNTGHIRGDGILHLPNYKILCMLADKDNRLWVGTTEGLFKQELKPPVISAYRYEPLDKEQYTGGFSGIYQYNDQLYACRFSRNKGLAIIRPKDMQLLKEVSFYGDNSEWNEIRSVEMYHPDTLWLGSNAGLLWYDTRSGTYGKVLDETKYPWAADFYPVLAPARKDGYAWMCSMLGGKVVRYHIPSRTFTLFTSQTTPALPFDRVKSIAYDAYGDVWISGHSLTRWNNQRQEFDTVITVYSGANKFNDNIISLSTDADGSLWFHNAYNGLLEYQIREKKFVAYSMQDGLPSEVLQALSPVIDHKLWIAGSNHLALFDTRSRNFTIYDATDGFPDQKPTSRRIYYDAGTGYMYLGSNEYLVKFPLAPVEETDNSSRLIIEEVSVDNKRTLYLPDDELRINYNENNLRVNYTVIDFDKPNYQFAFRMNQTGQWIALGDQRNISLSNLPPGSYSIELRAFGKPGIEKINAFFFVIRSPFWRTPLFIAAAFVVLAAGLYFLYRNRISDISRRANLDKLLSQTEMKALQAQMNPHFVFNSLNSIGEMILNNENKDASNYLSKFARLIRITLDHSSQSIVSLRNTIDYLERYMEMENIRNSQFTHEIRVDPALDQDEMYVPPMLIQPFIENALWHGVSATNRRIHVRIDFLKENETLVCKIDDNGIGISQAHQKSTEHNGRHQSVGITNIQNRVALLNEKYNLHCDISIVDKKDIPGSVESGTLVTLHLPLEIEES